MKNPTARQVAAKTRTISDITEYIINQMEFRGRRAEELQKRKAEEGLDDYYEKELITCLEDVEALGAVLTEKFGN